MKRRFVLYLALIAVALLAISYIPVTISKSVVVNYPFDRTREQFLDSQLLAKWFYVERSVDNAKHQVKVTQLDPAALSITASDENGQKKKIIISLSPEHQQPLNTVVTMKMKGTISEKLFPSGSSQNYLITCLDRLQYFMENPVKMYGFNIRKVPVTDTSFLFMTRTVPTTRKKEETKLIFDELISFASQHNITYNGVRIFHTERISKETIQLFASIGVSSYVPDHPSDSILIKHMPYGKNLLEAEFEGTYKNIDSVYKALEDYKNDRNLVNMAIPFEKFISPGYGFADTQHVRINVYYPFY